jgi:hypothetical protein
MGKEIKAPIFNPLTQTGIFDFKNGKNVINPAIATTIPKTILLATVDHIIKLSQDQTCHLAIISDISVFEANPEKHKKPNIVPKIEPKTNLFIKFLFFIVI